LFAIMVGGEWPAGRGLGVDPASVAAVESYMASKTSNGTGETIRLG
jgi:hypothetical protein